MAVRNLFFRTLPHRRGGCEEWVKTMVGDKLVAMRPCEHVCQDAEPIAAIYRNLGTPAAERVVNRALGELAMTVSALARQVRRRDLSDLARQLRRLQGMAESLGMVSLGLVASDLRNCLDQSDVTGFSAVWARLLRVAELSLSPDKELLDLTRQ